MVVNSCDSLFRCQRLGAIYARVISRGIGIGMPTLRRQVLILRCLLLFDDLELVE